MPNGCMTKKQIKELVIHSYKNGKLDPKIVETIADRLTRHELKQYIYFLKQEESKKEIHVTSADALSRRNKEIIEKQFPDKTVTYAVDPSMISGIKIVEDDLEYEINLNRIFNDIMVFLSKDE